MFYVPLKRKTNRRMNKLFSLLTAVAILGAAGAATAQSTKISRVVPVTDDFVEFGSRGSGFVAMIHITGNEGYIEV